METKNIWRLIAIITTILFIAILLFIIYGYIKIEFYQNGFNDGQNLILNTIQATGQIPIFQNNQTQWITIGQLCSNIYGG